MLTATSASTEDILSRVPRRRVCLALWVAIVFTLMFTATDLWLAPAHLGARLACELVETSAMIAGLLVLWRHSTPRAARRVGELAMLALIATSTASAVVTGEHGVVPVVAVAIAMGAGAFLPLGLRPQLRIAAGAAVAVMAEALLRGDGLGAYPAIGAVLGIGSSLVAASETNRIRTLVDASLRSQRNTEARFEHLAASAPTVFWWLGPTPGMHYISPAFENIWGTPPAVACRSLSSVLETIHPDDRARIFRAVQDLAARGLDEEFRIVRPDRSTRVVRTRAYLVQVEGMPALTGMTEDVTLQRRTEDELRQSRERYAGLVENAPDPVLTFDGRGRLLSANPAMERLVERRADDLKGMHFLHRGVLARSSRRVAVGIARSLAANIPAGPHELELMRRGGGAVRVETNQRVVGGAGESVVVEVILRDVTERRRAEDAVRLRAFAAHVDAVREQERSRFARRLHDEFAQSMAALGLHLGWLSQTLPSELAEPAAKVHEMEALLTSVLTSLRAIISDLRPTVLDHFGLAAAVRWKARDFQRRTGIECVADVETDDEIGIDDRAVAVFRTLQDALDNVEGRDASRVHVRCRIANGVIAIHIEDDGSAIAASSLPWDVVCMQERIHLLGGSCDVASPERGGMSVHVRVTG